MNESCDSIKFWLDNAGRYPILTQEQLSLIYKRMENVEQGSPKYAKLLNKVVNSNLRLVVKIVVSYMKSKACKKWGTSDSLDYLQAGSMGLMHAARKYDPRRGYRFSTYAFSWIKCYVARWNLQASSLMKISEEACKIAHSFENSSGTIRTNSGQMCSRNKAREIRLSVRMAQAMLSLDAKTQHQGATLMDIAIDTGSSAMSLIDEIEYLDRTDMLSVYFKESNISDYERSMLIDVIVNNTQPCTIDRTLGLAQGTTLRSKRELVSRIKKNGAPDFLNMQAGQVAIDRE
jgi:RNA polymerase sigma factor (sigma-70 family)